MKNTKELRIKRENIKLDCEIGEHQIWHPLYMECYISGLQNIFDAASEQKEADKRMQESVIINEKSNVLTFIGKRGAGKTTAMDEFCRILKSLETEKEKKWWMNVVSKSLNYDDDKYFENIAYTDFKFHVLDPIDASLFGMNEDLFEQIVVNIYRQFESKIKLNESNKNTVKYTNQIMQQFADIMKMYYSTIRGDGEYRTSDSMAEMMQFLSSTQNIQKAITELVDSLLKISDVADMEYIVIPIDDLDLNIKQGYQMLEKLQKYFTYHKILILLTVDYDQMRFVCEEHFGNELVKINDMNGHDIAEAHKRELARDFMTKMFHLSQRLCMPNLEKDLKRTYIICGDEEVVVKKYIFKKIAHYMGIWYDIKGLKKHFAEPKTVRELVVYNDFLNSLNECDFASLSYLKNKNCNENIDIKKKNEDILKKYDQNHERFNEDIRMRMAQNLLRPEQRDAFERLCDRDLERRARYFVCSKRVEDKIIMHTIDASEYSYGDLLQKIYEWGRDGEQDSFIDKPYISCVLASFTSEMVREYLHYLYAQSNKENKEEISKHQKRLMGILGKSFGNRWTGDAFPKIFLEWTKNEKVKADTKRITDCFGYKNNTFPGDQGKISFEFNDSEPVNKDTIIAWIKDKKIIPILELVDMFVIGKNRNGIEGFSYTLKTGQNNSTTDFKAVVRKADQDAFESSMEMENSENKENQMRTIDIYIKPGATKLHIDAMAFVIKSMFYDQEKDRMQSNLLNLIKEVFVKFGKTNENIEDDCRDLIRQESIIFPYDDDGIHQVAFPFYNLDLSYNVYKRVWGKFHNSNPVANLELAMKDFLGEIENQLNEEWKEYNGEEKQNKVDKGEKDIEQFRTGEFNYARIFKNNNYVKAVLDYRGITKKKTEETEILEKEQKLIWEKVQEVLVNMSIANDVQAEKVEDEIDQKEDSSEKINVNIKTTGNVFDNSLKEETETEKILKKFIGNLLEKLEEKIVEQCVDELVLKKKEQENEETDETKNVKI